MHFNFMIYFYLYYFHQHVASNPAHHQSDVFDARIQV